MLIDQYKCQILIKRYNLFNRTQKQQNLKVFNKFLININNKENNMLQKQYNLLIKYIIMFKLIFLIPY